MHSGQGHKKEVPFRVKRGKHHIVVENGCHVWFFNRLIFKDDLAPLRNSAGGSSNERATGQAYARHSSQRRVRAFVEKVPVTAPDSDGFLFKNRLNLVDLQDGSRERSLLFPEILFRSEDEGRRRQTTCEDTVCNAFLGDRAVALATSHNMWKKSVCHVYRLDRPNQKGGEFHRNVRGENEGGPPKKRRRGQKKAN